MNHIRVVLARTLPRIINARLVTSDSAYCFVVRVAYETLSIHLSAAATGDRAAPKGAKAADF